MDQSELKVGDKLAFRVWNRYAIYPIDKIMPSGRIKCGPYELEPDLRVRGRRGGMGTPFRAEHVTDEIRQECLRDALLSKIAAWTITDWRKTPTETLKKIVALMEVKP